MVRLLKEWEGKKMGLFNLKKIIVIIFWNISIMMFASKLSTIEGVKKLENYNELKNIESERIVRDNLVERNKQLDKVFVKGEKEPFNGIVVVEKNKLILGLYFYVNGKGNGLIYKYYPNGKLSSRNLYKNDYLIQYTDYNKDGSIYRKFKSVDGINGVIEAINDKYSIIMNVIQEYNSNREMEYIQNGKTTVYERNGSILGELNFNNGSLLGERQKLYKNGKLKYDFIGGTKDIKGLKAMRSYIEYYDNSDIMKYNCDEVTRDNWKCKEYSKDGSFKQNVDGRKYVSVNNNHHGNIWINIFLGAWNILNP